MSSYFGSDLYRIRSPVGLPILADLTGPVVKKDVSREENIIKFRESHVGLSVKSERSSISRTLNLAG